MPPASTTPEKEARIRRMLAGGASNRDTAWALNVSESVVSRVRRSMPVEVRPELNLPNPVPVHQTGTRWSDEHRFWIKEISPAWASGDIDD